MAIQYPNFLGVPVRTPDYSGLADIVQNYYAGKAMPKDDLMKAIQAEFARPTAEQSLLAQKLDNETRKLNPETIRLNQASTKLGNRKSLMEINKMAQEMQEQAAFERQLQQALGGAPSQENMPSATGMRLPPPRNSTPIGASSAQASNVSAIPGVSILGQDEDIQGLDRTKIRPGLRKYDMMSSGLPLSAYTGNPKDANTYYVPDEKGMPVESKTPPNMQNAPIAPTSTPVAPIALNTSAQPELNETVITKGSPHLAGVDQMYDNNPLSRAFLEKKGYKKTQEVKFDNKTGKTTIMTKYPSGKVTLQSVGGSGAVGEDGIPLTNNQITKHQNVIASVDVAVPVIEQIRDLKSYPKIPGYHGGEYATYNGLVSQALDSMIGAMGMPSTNEGLKSVREQIERTTFETDAAYRKRLGKLIEDLNKRKQYSSEQVKRSNKISPVSETSSDNTATGSADTYSSDDWEAV